MNEGSEVVEWRFFLPATEHLDPASIEAVRAFDALAAGVIPAEPERRCDLNVTCDETCASYLGVWLSAIGPASIHAHQSM